METIMRTNDRTATTHAPTPIRSRRPSRRRRIAAIVASLAMVLTQSALAQQIAGRVVGITDGDTLTLLTEQRQEVRVRLSDIDAPERGQPWGNRAPEALAAMTFGQAAEVAVRDVDRYGRTVGRVTVGQLDVNAELVKAGSAWVYRRYSRDPGLAALEDEAKAARRGLWNLPEADRAPPWSWRAAGRQERPAGAS